MIVRRNGIARCRDVARPSLKEVGKRADASSGGERVKGCWCSRPILSEWSSNAFAVRSNPNCKTRTRRKVPWIVCRLLNRRRSTDGPGRSSQRDFSIPGRKLKGGRKQAVSRKWNRHGGAAVDDMGYQAVGQRWDSASPAGEAREVGIRGIERCCSHEESSMCESR